MIANITNAQDIKLWKITIAVPDDSELASIFGVDSVSEETRHNYLAHAKVQYAAGPIAIASASPIDTQTDELTPLIDHFKGVYKYVSTCKDTDSFRSVDTFCHIGANTTMDGVRFLRHYANTILSEDAPSVIVTSTKNGDDDVTKTYYANDGLVLGFFPKEYIEDHVALRGGTTTHSEGQDWLGQASSGAYSEYGYADALSLGKTSQIYDATPLYSGYPVATAWNSANNRLMECIPASTNISITGSTSVINTAYYKKAAAISSEFVTDESVVSADGNPTFGAWHYVKFRSDAFPTDSPYARYNGLVVYKIMLEVDRESAYGYDKDRANVDVKIGLSNDGTTVGNGGTILNSIYNADGSNSSLPDPYSNYVYEQADAELSARSKKAPLVIRWADSVKHVAKNAMSTTALTAKAVKDFIDDSLSAFANYVNGIVGTLINYVDTAAVEAFSGTKITYRPIGDVHTQEANINSKIDSGVYRINKGDNMLKGTLPPIDDYTGYLVVLNMNDADNYSSDDYNESTKIRVRQTVYPDSGDCQSPWTRVGTANAAVDSNNSVLYGYLDADGNDILDDNGNPARDTLDASGVKVLPTIIVDGVSRAITTSDYTKTYPLFEGHYSPNPLYTSSDDMIDYVSRNEDVIVEWSEWSMMGGGLRRVLLTKDTVANINTMYESYGNHTLTLPDPTTVSVGTKIGLEQYRNEGKVVCGEYAQATESAHPVVYPFVCVLQYRSTINDGQMVQQRAYRQVTSSVVSGSVYKIVMEEPATLTLSTLKTTRTVKGGTANQTRTFSAVIPYEFDYSEFSNMVKNCTTAKISMWKDGNLVEVYPTNTAGITSFAFKELVFTTVGAVNYKPAISSSNPLTVTLQLEKGDNFIGFSSAIKVTELVELIPTIAYTTKDFEEVAVFDAKTYLFECCLDKYGAREWCLDYDHCESKALSDLATTVSRLDTSTGRKTQVYKAEISDTMTTIQFVNDGTSDYADTTQFNLYYYDQYIDLDMSIGVDTVEINLPAFQAEALRNPSLIKITFCVTTHMSAKTLLFVDESDGKSFNYTIPANKEDAVMVTLTGVSSTRINAEDYEESCFLWHIDHYTE